MAANLMRRLRAGAKQLRKLHNDLQLPTLLQQDWTANVFARQSVGDDAEVELWYLAEHFVLAWHEWHGLQERFRQYLGQSDRPFPAAWRPLDRDCAVLANRLLHDERLDALVFDHWGADYAILGQERLLEIVADGHIEPALDDVYHMVVENHRRWLLIRDVEWLLPEDWSADEVAPGEEVWPRSREMVGRLNEAMFSVCDHFAGVLRQELWFHLRHFQRANVLVSWLVDGQHRGRSRAGSALLRLLSEEIVMPSIEEYLSGLQDPDVRGVAARVLERVVQAIGEIGYDDFVEDVSSGEFHGGEQSLVGSGAINLIPSRVHGPCQGVLLAVSKGDKRSGGFPNIMRQAREHLIRCPATRAVIVLCDHWGPAMLDEHIGDLRAQHARGVRVLFLMAGTPRRVVAPVGVDLGLSP